MATSNRATTITASKDSTSGAVEGDVVAEADTTKVMEIWEMPVVIRRPGKECMTTYLNPTTTRVDVVVSIGIEAVISKVNRLSTPTMPPRPTPRQVPRMPESPVPTIAEAAEEATAVSIHMVAERTDHEIPRCLLCSSQKPKGAYLSMVKSNMISAH